MHRHWKRLVRTLQRVRSPAGRNSEKATESLLLMAERCGDVVFRFGSDGRARYISPSVERLFGCPPAEIYALGGDVVSNAFVHGADKAMVGLAVRRHFSGDLPETKLEFRIVRRNGTVVWVQTNCSTITDPNGRPTDIILTMRDITEKKVLEAELKALARTDPLTGLANRRAFDEVLDAEWRRAARDGSALSLALLDIDHFKAFNDAYGHQAGDDCLRSIAQAIRTEARRAGDLAARYGGEEFAIVLPVTETRMAVQLADEIRGSIESLQVPHPAGTAAGVVTVSVGVATAVAAHGASLKMPAGLLQAADRALYEAKASGRNRVETGLLLTPQTELKAAS